MPYYQAGMMNTHDTYPDTGDKKPMPYYRAGMMNTHDTYPDAGTECT